MSFGGRLNPDRGWRLSDGALAAWSSGRVFCMRISNSARYPICGALFLADEAAVRLLARLARREPDVAAPDTLTLAAWRRSDALRRSHEACGNCDRALPVPD